MAGAGRPMRPQAKSAAAKSLPSGPLVKRSLLGGAGAGAGAGQGGAHEAGAGVDDRPVRLDRDELAVLEPQGSALAHEGEQAADMGGGVGAAVDKEPASPWLSGRYVP